MDSIVKTNEVDCERWLNELTHKYLEFVRKHHLYCSRGEDLQYLRSFYEKLKYGDSHTPAFEGPVECVRPRNNELLTVNNLKMFSSMIELYTERLDSFICRQPV